MLKEPTIIRRARSLLALVFARVLAQSKAAANSPTRQPPPEKKNKTMSNVRVSTRVLRAALLQARQPGARFPETQRLIRDIIARVELYGLSANKEPARHAFNLR